MHGLWKGGAAVSDTYDFGACVLQVREIDRLRARIAVLEAALRDLLPHAPSRLGVPAGSRLGIVWDRARAALAHPAATGEGGGLV